jgi:FdrA protein
VAVVVGTDDDPQGLDDQIEKLRAAGAWVDTRNDVAIRYAGQFVAALSPPDQTIDTIGKGVALDMMKQPLAAINAGLESFAESIRNQDATAIHVDWRPPASGNEKLASILQRMKKK